MTLPSALYDQRLKASHVRTRRPLSLYYTEAVPSGSQDIPDDTTVVKTYTFVATSGANGSPHDKLIGAPGSGRNGYGTGNASHLHLQIENNDTAETVTVYGYNYVFKKWGILYIPMGQNQATADTSFVAATFATIDGVKQVTIPIHGIDRIAFVEGSSTDASYIIRAAVSTF